MSQWRKEAVSRLPELRKLITDKYTNSPMTLWIELSITFEELAKEEPLRIDLLRRLWSYCEWCVAHRSGDVSTAAALGFCEHLIDSKSKIAVEEKIMDVVTNFPKYKKM